MTWASLACLASAGAAVVLLASPAGAAFPGHNGLVVFDKGGNLYTETMAGKTVQLTRDGHTSHARWSADGKHLVFTRSNDIYTMLATGKIVKRLTHNGGNVQPAWSRTGQQIVFVHVNPKTGHGDIYKMSNIGTSVVQLTNDGSTTCGDDHPTWSPIDNTVLFHQFVDQAGEGCPKGDRPTTRSTGCSQSMPSPRLSIWSPKIWSKAVASSPLSSLRTGSM